MDERPPWGTILQRERVRDGQIVIATVYGLDQKELRALSDLVVGRDGVKGAILFSVVPKKRKKK